MHGIAQPLLHFQILAPVAQFGDPDRLIHSYEKVAHQGIKQPESKMKTLCLQVKQQVFAKKSVSMSCTGLAGVAKACKEA